jgi:hypothetical protein
VSNSAVAFLAVLLGCTTTAAFGVIGVIARAFYKLSLDVRLMRQGATEGAQTLIRALASRMDVLEDVVEQSEEKIVDHNTRLVVLTNNLEGHIKTPITYAHPPQPI